MITVHAVVLTAVAPRARAVRRPITVRSIMGANRAAGHQSSSPLWRWRPLQ